MKVIMPYSHKDYNLAFYAAKVLLKYTNIDPDKFYLYGSQYAPNPSAILSRQAGTDINFIKSDYDAMGHPSGPNYMFAGLMNIVEKEFDKDEPIFLAEPDGFPTTKDWYDRVKTAHEACETFISGAVIDWLEDLNHINGNLVLHPKMLELYPWMKRTTVMAWDCFHKEIIMANGADNPEIHNPKRDKTAYPTSWWFSQQKAGKTPAWIHGCQTFQCYETLEANWRPDAELPAS